MLLVNMFLNFTGNKEKLKPKEVFIIKNVALSKTNCEITSAFVFMAFGKEVA